jgi:hypothetical protein
MSGLSIPFLKPSKWMNILVKINCELYFIMKQKSEGANGFRQAKFTQPGGGVSSE